MTPSALPPALPSALPSALPPAFIALLDFDTAPIERRSAIEQLQRERPVVEAMPGCVAFRVFEDVGSDTGITVIHEWVDQPSFTGYLASDAFARSNEILRPMMMGSPRSRRFRAELVEMVA
jgi:quinol monooxygenase YgiN